MASNADKPTERIKRVRRTSKKIAAPGAEPVAAQETAAYEPSPAPPTAVSFLAKGTVRHHEITAFLRQTIMLLEAGTPILKTLHTLSERGERRGIRGLASDITQYVEAGNPLWQAFERHPRHFDRVFVALIKASEASGTLVPVLKRLVEYRERREVLRKRVQTAMIYPVVLVVVALSVMMLIAKVVVPQFEDLFSKLGVKLPMYSQYFIATVNWFATWWWAIVVVIVVLLVLYKLWVRSPLGRLRADRLKLHIPIVGPILRNNAVSEFTRSLSLLLRSGLSMMVTLDLVRTSVHSQAMAQLVMNLRDSVEQGQGLEAPLRAAPDVVPPLVTDMLVTGEESGQLDQIAEQMAQVHETEVEIAVGALGETLVPILTIILGIFVAMLALALFVPMVDMINKLNAASGGGIQ